MKIITDSLLLKKLTTDHSSDRYVEWMNDPIVNRYLESGGDYDIEKLNNFLKEQEEKNILFWAIHIKNNNKHIGNIKINPIVNNIGEYGILIGDKTEWGKGYAKEASQAVIEFCFNKKQLSEIRLGVKPENINAIKLYKNLGFKVYDFNKDNNSIRMSIKPSQKNES